MDKIHAKNKQKEQEVVKMHYKVIGGRQKPHSA